MTFTTLTFLLFLPVVFGVYWLVARRTAQNAWLVLASYAFYGWWDERFCVLMLASSLVDFLVGLGLGRARGPGARRALVGASLAANLGLLGFFKYFDFFADGLRALAAEIGWRLDPVTLRIVLPVGISFYTFQTLSYTIDVYRGRMRPTRRLVDYLAYVSFFPQLVAGPIERATRLLPQFQRERRFDPADAAEGCRRILWGFAKKLMIADRLAVPVDDVFGALDAASGPEVLVAMLLFPFQVYCDFSAYSDIAIGTARLFGFRLMRNFAYPFFSQSQGELWRRWHVSLSTWFRDYVFIPLGGSRGGRARTVLNLLVTFVLSGLWHGAAWHFVAWGFLCGVAVLPGVLRPGRGKESPVDVPGTPSGAPDRATLLRILRTFAVLSVIWTFFRAPALGAAVDALVRVPGDLADGTAWSALGDLLTEKDGAVGLLLVALLVVVEWTTRHHEHPLGLAGLARWQRWAVYTLLLWLVLFTGPRDETVFIYFQF